MQLEVTYIKTDKRTNGYEELRIVNVWIHINKDGLSANERQ